MLRDELRRVSILSLGGTIASLPGDSGGAVPKLSGDDLVRAVPGLDQVARVDAASFRQIPSGELRIEDILELVNEADKKIAEGAAGVVVTQGTDSLEETSFVADLLRPLGAPLVFTGAMRNPGLAGPDGPANILSAVRVAADPSCAGMGTLVVLNDEIHSARFVHKTHTSNPATFESYPGGPLGFVTEDRVRIVTTPVNQEKFSIDEKSIPHVGLLKVGIGDDGRLLSLIGDAGFQGLVIEGFGGGHVTEAMVEELTRLEKTIPVVLASRAGRGEVLRNTYGFPGSEEDLIKRGLIPSGWLDGLKSRVLLSVLLAANKNKREIASIFDSFGSRVV